VRALALLAMGVGVSSAAGQPVVVPNGAAGSAGGQGVNTPIRNLGQPRTYQVRLREGELRPAPVVAPPAYATAPGTGNLNTLVRDEARTYQMRIPEAEVGVPIGSEIDGVWLRLGQTASNPAAWPAAGGASWNNYEVALSEDANPGSNLSSGFGANQRNAVMVRRGPLAIPAGLFLGGSSPNPWGAPIRFQRPYRYAGGNLILTVTHDGSGQALNVAAMDVVSRPGQAIAATSFRAATGSATTWHVVQLSRPGLRVGDALGGLSFRLEDMTMAAWPPSAASWGNYELTLGEDARPGLDLGALLAENQANAVAVRAGALALAAGAFPVGGSPKPWGPEIAFDRPWAYAGGNAVLTLSHDGGSLAAEPPFLDSVTAAGDTMTASSFRAALGTTPGNPLAVVRLSACPTGWAALPASNANVAGDTASSDLLHRQARTYQAQVSAGQLAGVTPGEVITAIQFRNDESATNPASWPPAGGARFEDYEIMLSQAGQGLGSFGSSVAGNQRSPVTVRRGPLEIAAGSYARGSSWGPEIPIQAYTYRGGDLVVTVSHGGHGQASGYALDAATPAPSVAKAGSKDSFRSEQIAVGGPVSLIRARARATFGSEVLWEGGSIVNRAFGGASGADASVLVPPDQAMGFVARADAGSGVADRLDVVSAFGWRLDSVEMFAFQTGAGTGASTITQTVVNVWRGVPRQAGSELVAAHTGVLGDAWSGVYRAAAATPGDTQRPVRRIRVDMGGVVVSSGAYFVEMAFRGSGALEGPLVAPAPSYCGAEAGHGLALSAGGVAAPAMDGGKRVSFPFVVRGFAIACAGDYNGDAAVDFNDFLTFLNDFNMQRPRADLNGDGTWDFNDLLAFLNVFNEAC